MKWKYATTFLPHGSSGVTSREKLLPSEVINTENVEAVVQTPNVATKSCKIKNVVANAATGIVSYSKRGFSSSGAVIPPTNT